MSKTARASAQYADIAPAVPLSSNKSQTYTYQLPASQPVQPFNLVTIPFGRQLVSGVVMATHRQRPAYQTKLIERIFSARLTDEQVALARWISSTMHGGLGYTLRLFSPPSAGRLEEGLTHKVAQKQRHKSTSDLFQRLQRGPGAYIEKSWPRRWRQQGQLISECLARGQQILILVAEINQIGPIIEQLNSDQSAGHVAAYHAGRRISELGWIWRQVQLGQPQVVVGSQKAIYLPWRNLGLVVVEEEYLAAHKLWDQYPRLHNVTAAKILTDIHSSVLLYSSSWPSLNLWHHLKTKQVQRLKYCPPALRPRLLTPTIADRQARRLLPDELKDNLRRWINHKEKVLVFFNQRGAWQAIQCNSCQQRLTCPLCDNSLSVHGSKTQRQVMCHRCGYEQAAPKKCPVCGKPSLRFVGVGTQVMTQVIDQLMPSAARVYRLDADTAGLKTGEALPAQLQAADIVVGTAALLTHYAAASFDRIVWLFPERSLQYPDFRSSERTVLLLARLQALLRPRRSVLLVTRQPHLLADFVPGEIEPIFTKQLKERQRLNYPPFTTLARLTVLSSTELRSQKRAVQLRQFIERRLSRQDRVTVRGPYQGWRPKSKNKYQHHVLLAGQLSQLPDLYRGLPVDIVDIDPQNIL